MDIKEKLKQKKKRKIALIALCGLLVLGIVGAAISIESSDAKLQDGQGNVVVKNQDDTAKADKKVKEEKKDKTSDSSKTEKSEKQYTEEEKTKLKPKDIKVDNSKDPTASNNGNKALKPKKAKKVTVTLEIRCDSLSDHMKYLENKAIKDYIPKDGVILAKTTYKGTTENTVFDALNTLCRNNEIHIDYNYTAMYNTYYVKGINYLYEYDAGPQSGWMFRVNGWFPNYGCSSYYLSDGDHIEWLYSCRGIGADIGK